MSRGTDVLAPLLLGLETDKGLHQVLHSSGVSSPKKTPECISQTARQRWIRLGSRSSMHMIWRFYPAHPSCFRCLSSQSRRAPCIGNDPFSRSFPRRILRRSKTSAGDRAAEILPPPLPPPKRRADAVEDEAPPAMASLPGMAAGGGPGGSETASPGGRRKRSSGRRGGGVRGGGAGTRGMPWQ